MKDCPGSGSPTINASKSRKSSDISPLPSPQLTPASNPNEKKKLLSTVALNGKKKPHYEMLGLRGRYLGSLLLVYTMSVATNLITYVLKPIMLLYTNEQGWTSRTDTWYYTAMMVTTSVVPIVINPILTKWTDCRSPKEVFVVIPLLCAIGLVLMLAQNKWCYFIGITFTSGILSLRAARQAWILGAVPPAHTSKATVALAISFPIGSLLGPIVAVGVSSLWPDDDLRYEYSVGPFGPLAALMLVLDKYTVVYAVCFLMMSAQVILVAAIFKDACQDDSVSVVSSLFYDPNEANPPISPRSRLSGYSSRTGSFAYYSRAGSIISQSRGSLSVQTSVGDDLSKPVVVPDDVELGSSDRRMQKRLSISLDGGKRSASLKPGPERPEQATKRAPIWEGWVREQDHDGKVITIHSSNFTFQVFALFSIGTFLVNISSGVFNQILNPVLVNQFDFSLKSTAAVTTFHKICALLASMAIMPLAKHGRDVNLMILGLTSMIFGMLLFSWVPTQLPLVIIGSALLEQGNTFFLAMSVALLSKLLGRRAQGFAFGMFSSILMLGKGCATVLGGLVLQNQTVGTWGLLNWGIPCIFVWAVLFHPITRRYLDPDRPLIKTMCNPEPPMIEASGSFDSVILEGGDKQWCTVM
uniref:Major facilitator superfamily (MFS) profile domain-containing protein n=2 Tax=Eutreptiella gymnastica TaxID=73025 RepID=A0A7S1NSW6_9EUGL|mmetsp:Transcript_76433/g.134976  ORF Transcript_76433/g.134976 Transcript_76433/m.134976 type:complete len:640 (+) Transcript_76433:81-2000(+)